VILRYILCVCAAMGKNQLFLGNTRYLQQFYLFSQRPTRESPSKNFGLNAFRRHLRHRLSTAHFKERNGVHKAFTKVHFCLGFTFILKHYQHLSDRRFYAYLGPITSWFRMGIIPVCTRRFTPRVKFLIFALFKIHV
jgi:hypothetical protein